MKFDKITLLAFGIACGLSFAPFFFTPALFLLSYLCVRTYNSKKLSEAFVVGYVFGFGFFLSSLYWISIAPSVYLEEFWWIIPLALFGLPLFMALFIAASTSLSWYFRHKPFYHFAFCLSWLFFEWLTSWIFTGLPWALIGYSLSFSNIMIQSANLFSIFGLSFITMYVTTSAYAILIKDFKNISILFTTSLILIAFLTLYGNWRLNMNKTEFSEIKVRIVQPSIPQKTKWDFENFWYNIDKHIELSKSDKQPDLIIWSEAALTVPYEIQPVFDIVMSVFTGNNQTLIFGSVTTSKGDTETQEFFSSLVALDSNGDKQFEHNKSHLVPFGEYIPFKDILPMKKITAGMNDYLKGERKIVSLNNFNLKIQPIICYEAIFPLEIKISNQIADVIINVTNDSWYGNSSGPYQHFEISRMRAIENGLPMLRAANNGISAIIDPYGRVINILELNKIGVLDGYIPKKANHPTIFSMVGYLSLATLILIVLILQAAIIFMNNKINKRLKIP